MSPPLLVEREYDLAPEIVWDALVDDVLVSGWLAEASIEPRLGGRYQLSWHDPGRPPTSARIVEWSLAQTLALETSNLGTWRFDLQPLPGGRSGRSTRLVVMVEVEVEPVFRARLATGWMTALEQLDELLRGRPVDWSSPPFTADDLGPAGVRAVPAPDGTHD
jgi:uncharacterized protein YndB with AHSA1/START domain